MNGSSRLMGNTGADGSIIVGCGSKRRGCGAIMGLGSIVDLYLIPGDLRGV